MKNHLWLLDLISTTNISITYRYGNSQVSYFDRPKQSQKGALTSPFLTLFGVNGVQIRGCDFIDNRTYQHNYGEHAIGVLSFDATYRVIGRRLDLNNVNDPAYTHETYDTTDFDISTFKNLYKGIFAMNANSQSSVIIDHCKFEDSRIGIDVRAVNNMQITRNRFEFSTSHSSNITKMNHVIMEESSAFTIEGNQFYNDDLNSTTDGVVITNSGIENNNVFKNEFDDVYAANLAFGNNTNDELSFNPPRGLEWLCNNYNSIKYDQISVLYNPTFGDLKGVKLSQGNASSGAGNSFSNGLDAGSNEYHFSSEDPDEIVYFMYDNNSSSPSEINGNIMLLDDDIENACQSSFGGTILGVSGVTMLKESTKSTMLNNLDSYESYINQWTDTLDIRVENANTSQFYEDVQNLDTTSWGELYDELREASPYLKEDLLKLLGQQYSPHFPHNWYKTIITDNIEIARSNEFMRFLKTKRVPLPDAEYNEIDSLRFITTTERGDILSNLDRYDSRSTLYNNLLLTNEYSDTLETKWGTLDSLVEVRTDDLLGQQRTDLYLGVNDVTTAKNILNSIQPTSSEYKYVEDQLQDFIDFKNYLLDDELINTYGFIETLSSQDSADIVDYMNNSIGLPKKQAENILCFYSGDCDDFTYQYSYQGKSIDYDQEIYDDNEIQQVEIKVIPNPNEGAFSIVTNEREINGVFVTNSHGQRIELSEIVIDNNQAFISLRNSITGIYYIQVRFKSGLIETVKFAIF